MKIAAIQLCATTNKKKNIDKAVGFVEKAVQKGAKFILLPELFIFRGDFNKKISMKGVSEIVNGPTTKLFKKIAQEKKVDILLGSIYEQVSGKNKTYNTSVVIKSNGRVAAKYRKNNLFRAKLNTGAISETDSFYHGKDLAICHIQNFKIGLSICYDLRFSNMYRQYAKRKVDVITVPSNFTHITGKAHWESLLRARAIETLSYVIAPNQVGTDNRGIKSYGNSMVVSPWGEILARASGLKEQIIYADLKKEKIGQARRALPDIIK